ncbi:UDP-N-acetylmuramoyl-L-alanyl-D-glutamate--2,6-diaminopimelate ligase [Neptunicella marina]|nr:UDP-N-acetylmuramoyl-L-alanyl-D-glutamate--2,6-diaminopimelate ligase [Neptunicella marina]
MPVNLMTLLKPFGIEAPLIEIGELVLDSRKVKPNSVFTAVIGHDLDGRDFIPQAVSLGARVVLSETENVHEHGQISMREHTVIVDFYQLNQQLNALSALYYDYPATKLDVIAVTGTNGKTSTAQLCAQISQLTGHKAGTLGTLGTGLINQLIPNINTTPDPISIHKVLEEMRLQGAKTVALEASSHALVQKRLAALKTDVAIFTNLTRDHLDYHGTMANYGAAKRSLLNQQGLRFAVINQQDMQAELWLQDCPSTVQAVMYGFELVHYPDLPYCIASSVEYLPHGTLIEIDSSWGQATIETALLGNFNVQNLLAAITAQLCLGTSLHDIAAIASQLTPIAGRMEIFKAKGKAALVVDYAHTSDALEQALVSLRHHCNGQLWCMFGCGGDRDKGKRPQMGDIAERFADKVLVTNDNSRSESPEQIAQDILAGCQRPDLIEVELDRATAIRNMLSKASEQDLILVAGKGHEDYQIIGNQRLPYNERHYIQQLLEGMEQ